MSIVRVPLVSVVTICSSPFTFSDYHVTHNTVGATKKWTEATSTGQNLPPLERIPGGTGRIRQSVSKAFHTYICIWQTFFFTVNAVITVCTWKTRQAL